MTPPAVDLLHRPIAALVRQYGVPTSVATRDDGQRFVFADASANVTAIVDDDAAVRALDLAFPSGTSYSVILEDGKPHPLVFGQTTSLAARDALATEAETEGTNFRVFRRSPESDVVLVFEAKTQTLSHVVVGDRAALLRLGYLADPTPIQQRFPYSAPVLRRSTVESGSGTKATVLRLDVDRGGVVRNVAIVVPSDDATFDAALAQKLGSDSYAPAKLGGRAIGASVYREVRH